MNRLLISAAAAALILPVAACNEERQAETDATTAEDTAVAESEPMPDETAADPDLAGETEMETATTPTTAVTFLDPTDVSAEEIIANDIVGADGEKVGKVDDILINPAGKAEKLIFNPGTGVFDFTGKAAVNFTSVTMTPTEGAGEAKVALSITEEQADSAQQFEQQGLNDYRLASELLSAEVDIAGSDDDEAVIKDLIFTSDGTVKHVLIQRSAVGVGAGDLYAFDYSKLSLEQGDGGLILNVSEAELNEANKFEYTREDAADEAIDDDMQ
jgi:sporulation protein YlmC with PRC-barrel domain